MTAVPRASVRYRYQSPTLQLMATVMRNGLRVFGPAAADPCRCQPYHLLRQVTPEMLLLCIGSALQKDLFRLPHLCQR